MNVAAARSPDAIRARTVFHSARSIPARVGRPVAAGEERVTQPADSGSRNPGTSGAVRNISSVRASASPAAARTARSLRAKRTSELPASFCALARARARRGRDVAAVDLHVGDSNLCAREVP